LYTFVIKGAREEEGRKIQPNTSIYYKNSFLSDGQVEMEIHNKMAKTF